MKLISLVISLVSILFCIQLFAMVDISMDSYQQNLKSKIVIKSSYVPKSIDIDYRPFHEEFWNINEIN